MYGQELLRFHIGSPLEPGRRNTQRYYVFCGLVASADLDLRAEHRLFAQWQSLLLVKEEGRGKQTEKNLEEYRKNYLTNAAAGV